MGKVIDNVVWYSPEVLVGGALVVFMVVVLVALKKPRPTKYRIDR